MEDEMQLTINTYQELIGNQQVDDQIDVNKLKHEISSMS
jgi:hypothetical protein